MRKYKVTIEFETPRRIGLKTIDKACRRMKRAWAVDKAGFSGIRVDWVQGFKVKIGDRDYYLEAKNKAEVLKRVLSIFDGRHKIIIEDDIKKVKGGILNDANNKK